MQRLVQQEKWNCAQVPSVGGEVRMAVALVWCIITELAQSKYPQEAWKYLSTSSMRY